MESRVRKGISIGVVSLMLIGAMMPSAMAQEGATADEFNMLDLFVARPLGAAAGIAGCGLFILSLPFTIPSGSVKEAANMFIREPFRFSFKRDFPDRTVSSDGIEEE